MPRKADPRYLAADGFKLCKDCERIKPVSEFCKRTDSPDGFNRVCKECAGVRLRSWRADNHEGELARAKERRQEKARERRCSGTPPASRERYPVIDGMKRCTACDEVLPTAMFLPKGKTRRGLRPECRTCTKLRDQAVYQNSRERHLAHSRKQRGVLDDETRRRYAGPGRRRRKDDPEWRRRQDLERTARRYGLTVDDYDVMLAAQGGGCAICGAPPSESRRHHIDHDHETGVVRGLLCSNCNTAMGRFGDDPERLMEALRYLQDPPAPRHRAAMQDGMSA